MNPRVRLLSHRGEVEGEGRRCKIYLWSEVGRGSPHFGLVHGSIHLLVFQFKQSYGHNIRGMSNMFRNAWFGGAILAVIGGILYTLWLHNDYVEHTTRVENIVRQMDDEISNITQALVELNVENERLSSQMEMQSATIRDSQNKLKNEIIEIRDVNDGLRSQFEAAEAAHSSLSVEVDLLVNRADAIRNDIDDWNLRYRQLDNNGIARRHNELSRQVNTAQQEIKSIDQNTRILADNYSRNNNDQAGGCIAGVLLSAFTGGLSLASCLQ